jgi:peptidyl-prolyl cis-trans isomerase SurA
MNKTFSVKAMLLLIIFCLFGINNNIFSKPTAEIEDQTIMTLGNENITFGEVKRAYDKNAMRDGVPFELLSKDSAISFLETYSKYKMKVMSGIKAGYEKDSTIMDEINRNKKVIAESYLIDTEVVEPAIQRYTEMRKTQRQIAIIMSEFSPNGDTLEAYNKIITALKEINNGETFEFAAKKFSSDSLTAKNGGVVPTWVTGLKLQRELEYVIYSLKVGEITKRPLKTGYGYFLIKLLKEEPRQFISISYIVIPFKNDNNDLGPIVKDTVDAKRLADSIVQELSKGGKFNDFAEKFSSDKSTSVNGGFLGIYARSTGIIGSGDNIMPELENTAFTLKDGQISQPVETPLGISIIKRDSTVIFSDNFEYYELKSNYNRLFLKEDKQKFYDSLAINNYGFKINDTIFNKILSLIDTTKTIFDSNFSKSITGDLLPQTLFSINGKSYSVQNYMDSISNNSVRKIIAANREGLTEVIKSIIHPIVVENVTKNMDKAHPKLNMLIREFSSGLLLFKAEQENVWDKIKFDSTRAKKFYDTTKMNLTKLLQYDLSEIYIMSKKKVDEVYNDIKSGKITFDSAAILYTQRTGGREKKGEYGIVNTSNFLAYQAEKNKYKVGDISEPLSFEQGFSIIRINDINSERKMTFEEALPYISANVQTEYIAELQNNWLKELTKQYSVKYNNKLINKIFTKKVK